MRKGIYIAIFAILTMLSGRLNAQQFPVQVTTQIIPPFSLYLSDYTRPGSNALNVILLLNELGRFQYQGKLRITIQGQGVLLRTRDSFIPRSPVILDGGIPLQLTGADLEEYFDPRNLDFSGISRREYEQGGQLPEGFYTFCIEVLDFNRRDLVSNQGCASAWLILNDPPIINLPFNGEKERPKNPQNVIFQWTPRHTGSPNAAFTTEYVFTIVEINPTGRNPNDAIAVSRPIFETVTNSTTLVYGPAEPQLELGRQYAYRVQARDVEQRDLFKNRGFSEVNSFTYGDACQAPESVKAKALDAGRILVSWDPKWNNTGFSVWIRETGDNNAEWYEYESLINELTIVDLKPGTEYEYEVSGSCGFFESERSPVGTVSTDIAPEVEYACGIAIDPPELQNTTPIGSLKKGDVIIAGDFKVTLSEVSGGGGSFSGTGAIILPFLNRVKVNVEFSGITVNDEYRMVVGEMDVTGVTGQILDDDQLVLLNDVLDEAFEKLDDLEDAIETADDIIDKVDNILDTAEDIIDELKDFLPDDILEEIENAKNQVKNAKDQLKNANTPEEKDAAKVELKESRKKFRDGLKKGAAYYAQLVQDLITIVKEVIVEFTSKLSNKEGTNEVQKKLDEESDQLIQAAKSQRLGDSFGDYVNPGEVEIIDFGELGESEKLTEDQTKAIKENPKYSRLMNILDKLNNVTQVLLTNEIAVKFLSKVLETGDFKPFVDALKEELKESGKEILEQIKGNRLTEENRESLKRSITQKIQEAILEAVNKGSQ